MGIVKYYRIANLLSIDVAFGAICCSLFFSRLLSVKPDILTMLTLGVTVWSVYTFDHLKDSISTSHVRAWGRRAFHHRHRRVLSIALILSVTFACIALFFLPRPVILRGVLIIIPVVIYLIFQDRLPWLKEALVAVLYTGGILVPVIFKSELSLSHILLIISFSFIAFINLLIFSWYDHERDIDEGHRSMITFAGGNKTRILIWILSGATACCLLFAGVNIPTMILLIMLLAHVWLFIHENFFGPNERFRVFGEAVFFLPVTFLWLCR
jgi:4-hydroxybenzoate polyprenyltransferase